MKTMEFLLQDRYLLSVYVFFCQHEDELDSTQSRLFGELQREIFQGLTLEEVEQIEKIYSQGL